MHRPKPKGGLRSHQTTSSEISRGPCVCMCGCAKLQSGFKVLEIYPDACQRFFAAVATLTLPLIDDSDNTVRQEAAKVLARLVVQNKASSDLPMVVDRIPSHRRAVFDDELKKISKDPLPTTTPSPSPSIMPELRSVPTPLSPPGRRTSPLKQRLHAVPVESPKAQEPALPKSTPAQGISPASPDINPTGSPSETPLMKKMAEEIRNLRFKAGCRFGRRDSDRRTHARNI